jgi:Fic family protein
VTGQRSRRRRHYQAAVVPDIADIAQVPLPGEAESLVADASATGPQWAGRWRQQQVWIGGSNWGPFEAQYVAPHHERVSAATKDLARFLACTDIPPLTRAAVAHAHFETIHP